jgi:hypothetical protein
MRKASATNQNEDMVERAMTGSAPNHEAKGAGPRHEASLGGRRGKVRASHQAKVAGAQTTRSCESRSKTTPKSTAAQQTYALTKNKNKSDQNQNQDGIIFDDKLKEPE